MKVVSENETMPYNVSLGRNGYDHTKGTSANSDRERYGTDDDRGPQWDPRPVDYNRHNIRGPQRGTAMQYRSRTESNRARKANGVVGATEESNTGKAARRKAGRAAQTSESDYKDIID